MSLKRGASYIDDIYDEENSSELLLSVRASDTDQDAESDVRSDEDPDDREYGCCAHFLAILMYLLTDWPWETVKYISMPYNNTSGARASTVIDETITDETAASSKTVTKTTVGIQATKKERIKKGKPKPQSCKCSKECFTKLIVCSIIVFFRLLFVAIGLFVQFITCFRRDRISTDLTLIPNTTTKRLTCDEKGDIICGLLIPDMVIFLLAIWVYFGLKFGNEYFRGCFGWKELNVVVRVDSAENLNELAIAIDRKRLGRSITKSYTRITLLYIVLSQGVSVLYLFAFKLQEQDLIIQPPLFRFSLEGGVKTGMLVVLFVGFVALDLLYARVLMRYAYRCQMIIYYLYAIKHDVRRTVKNTKRKKQKYKREQEQRDQDAIEQLHEDSIKIKSRKEVMNECNNAYSFIKQLNASSGTVGFLILIAAYQAANCTVVLLSEDITYFQALAIASRLILWGFVAMFPFHKAAGVNIASKRLRDVGWDMHIPALGGPYGSNSNAHISLKARVFGISVNPWLPYVVVVLLLLTIMIGSKFKWYEHVL